MSRLLEAPAKGSKVGPGVGEGPGRLADLGLVAAFLGLAFLLGAFPLKDTDFWWHLRAGDLIRQAGDVPTADTFTFGAEGHRWVDLHWIFQVLMSYGYQFVGVPGLTIGKCVVTCIGLALLVGARRPGWPVSVMVLAWLPALLVLAGRMYVRPETLTFLYLAAYLAILFRVDDRPALAFALPVVQVFWVNSQGLFVLGPIVLGFALIDLACRPGAFAEGRARRWRILLIASGLVGLACLINPYGLAGALYPLQLAGTMRNEIFSNSIAELEPLPSFIRKAGLGNGPLQIHLLTIALGLLSFLAPIAWRVADRVRHPAIEAAPPKRKRKAKPDEAGDEAARPSLFRLLLFVAFTTLSWQASRNSHQFAAVVGTVTAWNFAEWAAEVGRRRASRGRPTHRPAVGRGVALIGVAGLLVAVGSGGLYAWEGEGRTIGLGEEPLWFPHEAVAFAGRPDMPRRSVCFHNGHAALYEYEYAPERKTYADARLEVVGPKVYKDYLDLRGKIGRNDPGWQETLEGLGRPLVLVDNIHALQADVTATLLTSPRWRCVYFDPVATLFVHEAYTGAAEAHGFDFGLDHFRRGAREASLGVAAETIEAKTCWNLLFNLDPSNPAAKAANRPNSRARSRGLVWAGLDHARAVQRLDPASADGWKWAGMIEAAREPNGAEPSLRFRRPFDPTFDLSPARASADLRRALDRSPSDGNALISLAGLDLQRGLYATSLALLDRFLARPAPLFGEQTSRDGARAQRAELVRRLGEAPRSLAWANLSELDRLVNALSGQGRAVEAADLMESAYPPEARPWEVFDRVATIRLHLGEPDRALALWLAAKSPPSEALRDARVAAARLASGDFAAARSSYLAARKADPNLFEAAYGLAVLEADSGQADAALAAARDAQALAPHAAARSALARLIEGLVPAATPPAGAG